MWYFMAGMEQHYKQISGINCDFGLLTFLGIAKQEKFDELSEYLNHILVDSGAYTFQRSKSVDFDMYVERYYNFIKDNTNNPKIVGFFEMDIDNVIGYDKVLEYRKKLEEVSDKIIPVWHGNRGITDYIEMCKKYSGKRVAITALGEDIDISQYNLFINTAHKYNCKIHILGMTNKELIKSLNLGLEDSFDSVSWALSSAFSNVRLNLRNEETFAIESFFSRLPGVSSPYMNVINYLSHRKIQEYYKNIDQSINVD